MSIACRIIFLSCLLGICLSLDFDLPISNRNDVKSSKDNELDKLLASIRLLVIELKNGIRLNKAKISSLETHYQLLSKTLGSLQGSFTKVEKRLNTARTTCHDRETAWQPYSGGPIMYLDRQAVTCPQGYFLSRFHLVRQADRPQAPVHYLFRCCKFSL